MIRRIVLAAAAAVALVLTPSVAMAFNAPMGYDAPDYTSTVSDSTPAVGQPIKVTIHGTAHERITLTITCSQGSTSSNAIEVAGSSSRVKAQTKQLNSKGEATWTVRFPVAGVCTLTMTNTAGAVVSIQTVTVHGVVADAAPIKGGQLGRTGFDGAGLAIWGGLFVLVGAGALIVVRRRRPAQVHA